MQPLYQAGDPFTIGIFVYPDVEELDFVGPFEVFKSAAYFEAMARNADQNAWQVFTVAETEGLVTTSGGLQIQPNYTFQNHPAIDLILIPGGDVRAIQESASVHIWLEQVTQHTRLNTSVCTGAALLGKLGLLDGHRATTHWSSLDRLAERFPKTQVQHNVRWVDEGTLITSAGVSAGIDMSLHLVERLLGRETAEKVARYMEYTWDEKGQNAS
ncbi:MAG TPA: DJ-1/PfpI family protein [Ktedonobacterales bacterium]|nr:DJ-1/PfpI family protein [Ktedonobacterales bacterium]